MPQLYPPLEQLRERYQSAQSHIPDLTSRVTIKKDRDSLLGEGSYGQVYLGWYQKNGQDIQIQVAVKCLMHTPDTKKKIEERLMREMVTWMSVAQHENVADLKGICKSVNDPPYLVMPFYHRNKFLLHASNHHDQRLSLAKDVARGLDHLHGNHVIHGDIKPENIMISDEGRAQIADFGVSVIPQVKGFTTVVNWNARQTAPELLPLDDSPPPKPTKESDIFSLGILLLQLFDGRVDCLPYNRYPLNSAKDPHDIKLIQAIHAGDRPRRGDYAFNHQGDRWRLIEACWAADPRARSTIEQVRKRLA
ncbi:hypothetical protein HWV62_23460 [Athelia sp. TMB]|nr:hypothetical protein HWV62_23460 [Athelia sp. TMB]